ncbi:patatin family protein [Cavenderia fasciculata]|uniref:Patatin family protein n=1 Tax=Cavenderia fasciculata TaxID=261658 RepID=F4QCZ1_CACFS|nr:patatin family protein [Cavenderia fasciculata]EGG13672.1 patatin family protein [Cavenderia fasciculata]|eukprot:XP_004350376.1 patatin family protein [Cavenderia fasciculata]
MAKLIISLDGGGMRGLLAVSILSHLEKQLGFDLTSGADLVGGASTGGIVAFCKALGIPTIGLENLYSGLGSLIFGGFSSTRAASVTVKENTDKLEQQMLAMFGSFSRLSKFKPTNSKLFVITSSRQVTSTGESVDLDSVHHPYTLEILANYSSTKRPDTTLSVVETIRATGALPFYLNPFIRDGKEYVDGGVLLNNTASIALEEAKQLFGDTEKLIIISIGTGYYNNNNNTNNNNSKLIEKITNNLLTNNNNNKNNNIIINLTKTFQDSLFKSHQQHLENVELFKQQNNVSYFRFDVELDRVIDIDDHDTTDIHNLKHLASLYLDNPNTKESVAQLLQVLQETNIIGRSSA